MKICRKILASIAIAVPMYASGQISGDVVKIGLITDMSGIYSDMNGPGSVAAAQMAIDDFGGKVRGKPVQLLSADSQNKADIGAATARRWIDQEDVDVLVDLVPTTVAIVVLDIAKQKNKIALVVGSATTAVTNELCGANSVHWMYDTYSASKGTVKTLVKEGKDTWYFIQMDNAAGKQIESDARAAVAAAGGKTLGTVRHPFMGGSEFSSYLLTAQASGAKVIGLANAGVDAFNTIKQAAEYRISPKQVLAPLVFSIAEVHALGLERAQGLILTEGFYWDRDEQSRAWSRRYFEKMKRMPTPTQGGMYSAVMHYLKAVDKAGTDDTAPVMAAMRKMPVSDPIIPKGYIREDGRLVHDMLLVEVKKPAESKGPWDYYKIKAVIPGEEAFKPLSESTCPLVKQSGQVKAAK